MAAISPFATADGPAPVPPQAAPHCDGVLYNPADWVEVTPRQIALYEAIGWQGFDFCRDTVIEIDAQIDTEGQDIWVDRGNGDVFVMRIDHVLVLDDYENYGLSPEQLDAITAANLHMAIFHGVVELGNDERLLMIGLTVSADTADAQRVHVLCALDHFTLSPVTAEIALCDDSSDFEMCRQRCIDDWVDCRRDAKRNYDRCGPWGEIGIGISLGISGGGLGGPVGGVLGGIFGGVVGGITGLYDCSSNYQSDVQNCHVDYQACYDRRRRDHCRKTANPPHEIDS